MVELANIKGAGSASPILDPSWQTQTRQVTVDIEKIGGSRAKGKTGLHLE